MQGRPTTAGGRSRHARRLIVAVGTAAGLAVADDAAPIDRPVAVVARDVIAGVLLKIRAREEAARRAPRVIELGNEAGAASVSCPTLRQDQAV